MLYCVKRYQAAAIIKQQASNAYVVNVVKEICWLLFEVCY